MDTFYQSVASFCFTLVGLWWAVTQLRLDEWTQSPEKRRLANTVFLSFLVPGTMSLAAQVSGDAKWVWQIVFAVAGLSGAAATVMFIRGTHHAGLFRKARWLAVALYLAVAAFAWFPEMAGPLQLKPLQVEGLMLALLVFLGAGLAWEFLTEPRTA